MSDVVNKNKKTVNVDRYIVSTAIDGNMYDGFVVEGAEDTEDALDRFLNWYLIFRSGYFPGIVRDDIEDIKSTATKVELEPNHPALAKYKVTIHGKAENFQDKTLELIFSKHLFGMLLR